MKKLIRDKLPEKYNLKSDRVTQLDPIIDADKFSYYLGLKLIEESKEALKEIGNVQNKKINGEDFVSTEYLIEELADVKEVFDTILNYFNIDLADVNEYQKAKNLLNGGFNEGYILEELEDKGE